MSNGSSKRVLVAAVLLISLLAAGCGQAQKVQGQTQGVSTDKTEPATTLNAIPLLPEGSFPPGYPAIKQNLFEPESDAPFPATVFLARNRRTIVTANSVYVVTAGRNGVESDTIEGAIFLQIMDPNSGKAISQEVIAVPECNGTLSLVDVDASEPRSIPIECLKMPEATVLSKGQFDADSRHIALSA